MKNNYLVTLVGHDRYYFSNITKYYNNFSFEEILKELNLTIAQVTETNPGFYIADLSYAAVGYVHPKAWFIMDLGRINKNNDYCEFIFGKTKSKFGIPDNQ